MVAAAPQLARVLACAPGVKLLVTSRRILRLSAEREVPVQPLSLPDRTMRRCAQKGRMRSASFLDRARPLDGVHASEPDVAAIVEICRRLDGLPLAIELAAARTRVLTPEAILRRLSNRLTCLNDGPRDLPERQRTLRDTIRWSYDLLEPAERSLFESLAVFVGGWSLEAAEALASPEQRPTILGVLASLMDKSLVRQTGSVDGEPRFGMLQTIQEFALEQLAARGDLEWLRADHAEYFIGLAEMGGPELLAGEQRRWMQRLAADHDNVRAAIRELLASGQARRVARLGWSILPFWWVGSHFSEGIEWMHHALASSGLSSDERALASRTTRLLLFGLGDLDCAQAALEDNVTSLTPNTRRAAAWRWRSWVSSKLCAATLWPARPWFGSQLPPPNPTGDAWAPLRPLHAGPRPDRQRSGRPGHRRAGGECRRRGSRRRERAVRAGADRPWLGVPGDGWLAAPERSLLASLDIVRGFGNRDGMARALEGLAALATATGDAHLGARLFGAARASRASVGVTVWVPDHQSHDRTERALLQILGDDAFAQRMREGTTLAIDELRELLAELDTPVSRFRQCSRTRPSPYPGARKPGALELVPGPRRPPPPPPHTPASSRALTRS